MKKFWKLLWFIVPLVFIPVAAFLYLYIGSGSIGILKFFKAVAENRMFIELTDIYWNAVVSSLPVVGFLLAVKLLASILLCKVNKIVLRIIDKSVLPISFITFICALCSNQDGLFMLKEIEWFTSTLGVVRKTYVMLQIRTLVVPIWVAVLFCLFIFLIDRLIIISINRKSKNKES